MKEFFLDKFDYEFQALRIWIEFIEDQEDEIDDFVKNSISHIINTHHIWNSRLFGKNAESGLWDKLPIRYLQQLNQQNFRETIDYLEKIELGDQIHYHSSEGVKMDREDIDILFHILNHSVYHRAQITMKLKESGLKYPSFNFIAFRD